MDDLLGLWWMMKEHKQIAEKFVIGTPMNTTIILKDRVSNHHQMLENFFSDKPIKVVQEWPRGMNNSNWFMWMIR
jgi:hypothetical protein